jgi:surface antigen
MLIKSPRIMTALAVASALTLAGCSEGHNRTGATLGGAAIGGLIGSQFGSGGGNLAMTALGTLAGAAIGSSVGKRMDEADHARMREAERRAYAAPINETIIWNNPNTGHSGKITPIRDGRRQSGEYCREFQSEINVGGQRERGYGTACQQPDGSWKIVS